MNERMTESPHRVLVTGASGAVGLATSELLAARGHRVAGTMRSQRGRNAEVAERLRAAGVAVVEMDVTDQASVDAGIEQAVELLGGLDVVFNNAGIGSYGVQEMFSAEEMHRVFDVNVYGVQRVMRAALPHLRRQGAGTVVYTSSLIGRVSIPFYGAYCASKWALEALAQAYRAELGRFGIDSFAVEPGALPTAFLDTMLTPGDRIDAYDAELAGLEPSLRGMQEWLRATPGQNATMVAETVVGVIEMKTGDKPFRVVADRTGMGEGIATYNEALGEVTRGIYAANGMHEMLGLNAGPT